MRLKPITATARRQGHRRKYLPTARPEGEADQYFRTGPTGGRPEQDGRSLPLSTRCRLTLHQCCEWEYRSPPAAEFACRATADASVTGGIVARRREFRGRMATHGDHRSARRHSRGSGSRLWPVPLPPEYYSPYNNISIRKLRENRAPKARREKQAARLVLTSRAAMLMGEGKKAALVLHYICPIMEFV